MTGHLIHIGYPKTGSNFLRGWFRQHPQLDYAEGGIAGFRDVYSIVRHGAGGPRGTLYRVTSAEGLATPHTSFGKPVTEHDTAWQRPMQESQAATCTILSELFPGAKVLIVTRGFRSAVFSMFSQFTRTAGRGDFATFCANLESVIPERGDGWDYCWLIALYVRAFGAENVIVMPWELLRDDVDRFVRTLEGRLGLEHLAPSRGRVNTSLSAEELYWYPRITGLVRRLSSKRLFRLYARAAFVNRFRLPIRILQRIRPGTPVTAADVPASLLAAYRGRADCLRDDALYAPYAADYLF
jgi:hypothetical protein